jgi:hypothetical protein
MTQFNVIISVVSVSDTGTCLIRGVSVLHNACGWYFLLVVRRAYVKDMS